MTKKHSNPMPELAIPKLSEGQLEPLFRRLNLAHTRRTYQEVVDRAEKENWWSRDFSLFCWPKKWRTASKPACSAAPDRLTFRSSKPLMSSISRCSRLCGNRCSVPIWDRTSSPRAAP